MDADTRRRLAPILEYVRTHRYAVEATVSAADLPQAAVVGIAIDDDFGIVFDTLSDSRKAANLRAHAEIAFVIGGLADGEERSVQIEGVAFEPVGAELKAARELYFTRFPDGRGRLAWPGLIHLRMKPRWLRYSDFRRSPPEIVEYDFEADYLLG
jgi:hypothetical protein